jgi:phosphoglycolate phosphatase
MKIDTIIWDWNGTLLNDTELCRGIINKLLAKRGINSLSLDYYKEIFTFPVKDYYVKAGFDFSKEDFKIPANEFIEKYNQLVPHAILHHNAETILEYVHKKDRKQLIISAMKQEALIESVQQKGIDHYFEKISGIDNHFAAGKLNNALRIFEELNLNPKKCLLIGDTLHDFEVSETIGCQCILIADGHQSFERLQDCGCKVMYTISELLEYL